MAIASALPSIAPLPVQAATSRGTVQPVTTSDSRDIAESRSPETARATDEAPELRNGRRESRHPGGDRSGVQLDKAQLEQLQELKARDREVRAHEQAHQAVGGQYAGAVSYTYERGPDGNQYAVGGEVPISVSPVQGDPQATIEKMRTVRAAALAPAEPSGQDRAVAAQAMQLMLQAQMELANEKEPGKQDSESGRRNSSAATDAYRDVAGQDESARDQPPFQAVA